MTEALAPSEERDAHMSIDRNQGFLGHFGHEASKIVRNEKHHVVAHVSAGTGKCFVLAVASVAFFAATIGPVKCYDDQTRAIFTQRWHLHSCILIVDQHSLDHEGILSIHDICHGLERDFPKVIGRGIGELDLESYQLFGSIALVGWKGLSHEFLKAGNSERFSG